MSADPKADMQDVLYGCLMHDRYDTSEQALDALMPHVDRYAAARTAVELRRISDGWYVDTHRDQQFRDELRVRADELDGGA